MDNNISVCLFFTYGISLKKWDEIGILDREIMLYRELTSKGIKVGFFTFGDKEDFIYSSRLKGIEIIPAFASLKKPKNRKIAFLYSLLLPFMFRKALMKFDIFKTNQMWGAWIPLIAKWITGKQLLVRCGFDQYYFLIADNCRNRIRFIFYFFAKIIYTFADHIILTTYKTADFVSRVFFIPKRKISVFANLIDTALFCPLNNSGFEYKDRIIFVGRLKREKNVLALTEACRNAGIGLDIVGNGVLRPDVEKLAQRIKADVRFLGIHRNQDLPRVFAGYRIFILPSLYEGNPKSLIEAMSCAKVVIGSNIDGINDLIQDGVNGILCGISAQEIACAILRVKDDFALQEKLGNNARRSILENFNLNVAIDNEFRLYLKLVDNNPDR